jgi:hypothetical protein
MGTEIIGFMTRPDPIGAPMNKKVFIACAIPGFAVLGYGVYGLFRASGQTQPSQWIRWFIGGLLVHDFVIAPLVFATAVLLVRRVPAPWKASLQGASIASGILLLAAWPYVAGYGARPDNKSLLPNNYGAGILGLLAFVWALALGTAWWRKRSAKRSPTAMS